MLNSIITLKSVCVLIVSSFALFLAWSAGSDETIFADPTDSKLTELGSKIYVQHCSSCHGVKLEGEPNWTKRKSEGTMPAPPHDASGHTWHHSDEILFKLTKFGLKVFVGPNYETDMPAYEEILSNEEILAVLAFIKSTWPEEIRNAQQRIN